MSVMESMERSKPRPRRSFTPEFKAEIVELCGRGDRSIGQVARDFDLTETAVREWVRQAERDTGTRRDGGLTSSERQELAALRRENQRLSRSAASGATREARTAGARLATRVTTTPTARAIATVLASRANGEAGVVRPMASMRASRPNASPMAAAMPPTE